MAKRVYATVTIDMENIDEKLKAVVEAQEKLYEAVYELERAAGLEGFTVQLEKPVANDGPKE